MAHSRWDHRHWVIIPVTELDNVDFSQVCETSIDTVRKSVDGTQTFVKWDGDEPPSGIRVIRRDTSDIMRRLMRLVVRRGTGKNADVEGYLVGGKTGTADKPHVSRRGYGGRRIISSFVSAFPMTGPRYVILAMLDEPKANAESHGYATGGWVAAPVVKNIVRQIATMAGIEPSSELEKDPKPGDVFYIADGHKRISKRRLKTNLSKSDVVKSPDTKDEFERRLSIILNSKNKPRGRAVAAN